MQSFIMLKHVVHILTTRLQNVKHTETSVLYGCLAAWIFYRGTDLRKFVDTREFYENTPHMFSDFTGIYWARIAQSVQRRAGRPRFDSYILHSVQTGLQVHGVSYPMGTGGSTPGGKAAGEWN
jgi:hypothetical protein